jgi:thioesterase domain-containing protein
MAQQLRDAGADVALVLMVENPRPAHILTGPSSLPKQVANRIGTRLQMEWSNLAEVARGDRSRYMVERINRLGQKLSSTIEGLATDQEGRLPFGLRHSHFHQRQRLGVLHEKAYEEYRPRPYEGRVAVLRAAHQPWGRATDPSLGWSTLVKEPVTQVLPGHRIGLLEGPRANRVAAIIEDVLRTELDSRADTAS